MARRLWGMWVGGKPLPRCPKCGSLAEFPRAESGKHWGVRCPKCGDTGARYPTLGAAERAWVRIATPSIVVVSFDQATAVKHASRDKAQNDLHFIQRCGERGVVVEYLADKGWAMHAVASSYRVPPGWNDE